MNKRLAAALAAAILGTALSAASCQRDIPGPGHCKPGYHHRLANQDPLGPWCIKDGSLGA